MGNALSVRYVADVHQLFEITVDLNAQTTSLSIDGVPMPEAQNQPFVQSAVGLSSIEFLFGGTPGASLVIDDLHIESTGCTSPVEPTSWGRVKGTYR